jgi:putative addiction module component (TIGR02574 family)
MNMGKHELIDLALQLNAAERYEVVEKIMQSLDKSDPEIDKVWAEEALHRAEACDAGRMKTISFDDVFGGKVIKSPPLSLAGLGEERGDILSITASSDWEALS